MPIYGLLQPTVGRGWLLESKPMSRQAKTPKTPGKMRHVLAANVNREMQRRFANESDKVSVLAKAAGVSRSTLQRTLDAERGASIDTIEFIAGALTLSTHQLLIPDDSMVAPAPADAKVHQLPARPGRVLINSDHKPARQLSEKTTTYTTKKRK